MFLQIFATLLPLVQTPEPPPSPGAIVARLVQTFFADPHTQTALTKTILALVLGVVINILAFWISSKVVAEEEKSTFLNALKLWALSILVSIAFVLLFAVAIGFAFFINQNTATICLFAGWGLLVVCACFLLPMRLYQLGFFRTLAFLIMVTIVSAAGQTAVSRTLHNDGLVRSDLTQKLQSLPSEERWRYLRQVLTGAPADALDTELDRLGSPEERAQPFPERQAALQSVYTQLDTRFKALPPEDPKALENYQRLRARYEKELAQLRQDYAASQAPAASPAAP